MAVDEAKMINGCLKGKRVAQRALYDAHKAVMFAVCLRYAGNCQEAEDMLQDGFVKVYRDLHQYRPIAPLGAWIRRVMINTCLEAIRKKKSRPVSSEAVEDHYNLQEDNSTAVDMHARDLTQLIQSLPEDYRLVFNLVALEGYSHKETAKMLEISESNSRVRLNRARTMLQEKVERIYQVQT